MTFDLAIWHAGSVCHHPGQVRRSRSQVKVHRKKAFLKWSVRPQVRAFLFGTAVEFVDFLSNVKQSVLREVRKKATKREGREAGKDVGYSSTGPGVSWCAVGLTDGASFVHCCRRRHQQLQDHHHQQQQQHVLHAPLMLAVRSELIRRDVDQPDLRRFARATRKSAVSIFGRRVIRTASTQARKRDRIRKIGSESVDGGLEHTILADAV